MKKQITAQWIHHQLAMRFGRGERMTLNIAPFFWLFGFGCVPPSSLIDSWLLVVNVGPFCFSWMSKGSMGQ